MLQYFESAQDVEDVFYWEVFDRAIEHASASANAPGRRRIRNWIRFNPDVVESLGKQSSHGSHSRADLENAVASSWKQSVDYVVAQPACQRERGSSSHGGGEPAARG